MVHPITQSFRPGHAGAVAAQETRDAKRANAAADATQTVASSKAADALESISSKAFLPQTFQFLGSMALFPVAWVAGKVGGAKAKTIVQAPLAAVNALETTTLGSLHQLPANVVKAFGAKATENGAEALAASAAQTAERLGARANGVMQDAARAAKPVAASVQQTGQALGRAARDSGILGFVNRAVADIAGWRSRELGRSAAKVAENIHVVHAREPVNMFGRVKQVIGGAPVMASGSIEAVQPLLSVAKAGQFDASHVATIRSTVGGLAADAVKALDPQQAKRLSAVTEQAEKLARVIDKKGFWDAAKTGGVGAIAKGIPAALARVPVARALLVTGVVAGSAAMLFRTKAENAHSGQALNALAADVYGVDVSKVTPAMLTGANAPALLKRASQDYSKMQRGNWMAGAAQAAGDALWLMPNATLGLVAGPMSGMLGDLVKSDNPYLNAYSVLKAEAKGQGVLKPESKVGLVTMLVGASPSIADHGGARNKLAKPIAEQMVAEKLTPEQMVREIASPQAIELRAVKAQQAKLEAEAKKPEAVKPANPSVPSTIVGAAQSHGRVVQNQLSATR